MNLYFLQCRTVCLFPKMRVVIELRYGKMNGGKNRPRVNNSKADLTVPRTIPLVYAENVSPSPQIGILRSAINLSRNPGKATQIAVKRKSMTERELSSLATASENIAASVFPVSGT